MAANRGFEIERGGQTYELPFPRPKLRHRAWLSLVAIKELSEHRSCKVGSRKARSRNRPADCNEGPSPRMATFLGELPVMINPAMATFSPVSTCKRVEMFKKKAE